MTKQDIMDAIGIKTSSAAYAAAIMRLADIRSQVAKLVKANDPTNAKYWRQSFDGFVLDSIRDATQ